MEKLPNKEERVGEILRKGVEELLVHGDYDSKGNLMLRPDLDSKVGAYLMGYAHVPHQMVRAIPKGSFVEGGVHIDTGGRPELTVENDDTVFFDHHGSEKGVSTSASQIVYETLVKTNYLRREKWIDGLTKFVTEIDNLSYPLDEKFLKEDWWRTPYGLYKVLPFEFMIDFFRKERDPRKPFTVKESSETTLTIKGKEKTLQEVCEGNRNLLRITLKNMQNATRDMKERGIKTETPELGKVVLNEIQARKDPNTGKVRIVNPMPHGKEATKALGYTNVLWGIDKSFFISSPAGPGLRAAYERIVKVIPEAKLIRGVMIVFPRTVKERNYDLDTLLTALEMK